MSCLTYNRCPNRNRYLVLEIMNPRGWRSLITESPTRGAFNQNNYLENTLCNFRSRYPIFQSGFNWSVWCASATITPMSYAIPVVCFSAFECCDCFFVQTRKAIFLSRRKLLRQVSLSRGFVSLLAMANQTTRFRCFLCSFLFVCTAHACVCH